MVKKYLKFGILGLILLSAIFLLTGCGSKTTTSTYDAEDEKVSVSLTYPDSEDYKWSTESGDLRTSSDKAILLGPDFKISIQFENLGFRYDNDFNKYKEKYMADENAKDVTIADINGFRWYYASYRATVVVLPIASNPKEALKIYVYTELDEEAAVTEMFNSDVVQSILKTLKITAK